MVRRKRSPRELEPHEGEPDAPAGAEGASSFGHRRPAGEDVLGEAERPDQPKRMDKDDRTVGITPPGPATAAGARKKAASRRLADKRSRKEPT